VEQPFRELEDLVRRARLKKDEVEALAEAGALEALVPGRRNALWSARAPRSDGLFRELSIREPSVTLPALSAPEQLVLDYHRKGLSIHDHPLRHLRDRLSKRGVVTNATLGTLQRGQRVEVAGLVLSRQQPGTASGIVFITLEDETGYCNLLVYRHVFERFHLAARHARLLFVRGSVERQVTKPPVPTPETFGPARDTPRGNDDIPIIHVIAHQLERLDVPGDRLRKISRDFH
jgi:error-prone DNA polymerase